MRRVSASASAAATDGLLMWTIDSLCVSSNSSACANEALANAANGAAVRSPEPHTRLGPLRRHRVNTGAHGTSERRRGAGQRQADHVEDAQLRGGDDVGGKIGKGEAGHPGRDLAGERRARRNR